MIALRGATRVDVSAGSHGHAVLGILTGGVAGLAVGELWASGAGCSSSLGGDDLCGVYDLIAIPTGAALGALVGALIRSESWRPVSGGITLRLAPGSNGMLLRVGMRF